MPFYIRKSFSAGPVRLNLSKSGIGTSIGVKGARMGIGGLGGNTSMLEGMDYIIGNNCLPANLIQILDLEWVLVV